MNNITVEEIKEKLLFGDSLEVTSEQLREIKEELLFKIDNNLISLIDVLGLLGYGKEFDWSQLISPSEAEERYGKQPGTIRKAISIGKFKEGTDCVKFGKQWVMLVSALEREYGRMSTK